MNFDLSAEQVGIQDALRRYVAERYTFERRRKLARDMTCCRDAWAMYAELGLLALPLPEHVGGLGGSGVDVMLVMQGFGEGLMLEPYLPTVILAGNILAAAGSDGQKHLLADIMEGRLMMAFAHAEIGARYSVEQVATRAVRTGGHWTLNGHKTVVLGAPFAGKLIVSARLGAGAKASDEIALFIVDRQAAGMSIEPYRMHDGTCAAEIRLSDVMVGGSDRIGDDSSALPLIEQVLDRGRAALCAEAVGAMQALMDLTTLHLRTRRQFGQPLAKFQALRHRAAEMAIHIEQARSMALLAAVHAGSSDVMQGRKAVSAAKALVGRSARFVGQQAIQLHGGMGLTDELSVGHYFKRLTMIEMALGDIDHHLGRFGDLMAQESKTDI